MTSLMDFCADAVTARRPSAAIMMLFSFFHGSIQISHKTRRKDTDFYGIMVHFPATFRIVWYYNAFEPYLSGTQAITPPDSDKRIAKGFAWLLNAHM